MLRSDDEDAHVDVFEAWLLGDAWKKPCLGCSRPTGETRRGRCKRCYATLRLVERFPLCRRCGVGQAISKKGRLCAGCEKKRNAENVARCWAARVAKMAAKA